MTANRHQNYINGEWRDPVQGEYFQQRNPAAPTEITGEYPASGSEDALVAITAAQVAFPEWRATNVVRRVELLRGAMVLMKDRSRQIAETITQENGKSLAESLVEVAAAVREMEYQISQGLHMVGETVPTERAGIHAFSTREPLGVVSAITPWNFPFNVPGRKVVPALVAGNSVVFKPASLTPGTGMAFAKLFADAGLPPGVLNMVTGSGRNVGGPFTSDPRIRAISFTGSTEVGLGIQQVAAPQLTRTQLELGGKNPTVILEDADLQRAVKDVTTAAFACAGQWCTSTSRVIVLEEVYDDFLKGLTRAVESIVVGNGMTEGTTMGPVCGPEQFANIIAAIDAGRQSDARLIIGGSATVTDPEVEGYFIQPTVFADVDPQSELAQEEIFGPVLSVIPAKDLEHAIQIANGVRYGLCSSIYTSDVSRAHTFMAETDVGLTHVNMMTSLKEPQLSFGGRKESGFGIPEAGKTGIEFFTQHKVGYINYGGGA